MRMSQSCFSKKTLDVSAQNSYKHSYIGKARITDSNEIFLEETTLGSNSFWIRDYDNRSSLIFNGPDSTESSLQENSVTPTDPSNTISFINSRRLYVSRQHFCL